MKDSICNDCAHQMRCDMAEIGRSPLAISTCYGYEKGNQTRADYIRAKSYEELAEWLSRFTYCTECPVRADGLCSFFKSYEWCADHWMEWLKKEVDNEGNRD